MGRGAQWGEGPNGSRDTMKNDISLARILLATACPPSFAMWAGSFTSSYNRKQDTFLLTHTRFSFLMGMVSIEPSFSIL